MKSLTNLNHAVKAALALNAIAILGACGEISGQSANTADRQSEAAKAQAIENFANLPLAFEENLGQTDSQVAFISRVPGYNLYLTGNEMVLDIPDQSEALKVNALANIMWAKEVTGKEAKDKLPDNTNPLGEALSSSKSFKITLKGANPKAKRFGQNRLRDVSNYFIGSDKTKWIREVPQYQSVKYTDIYPGVDAVYYGNKRLLEYDFIVNPGASPETIRIDLSQAKDLKINSNGDLVIKMKRQKGDEDLLFADSDENNSIIFTKPVIYQNGKGKKNKVDGKYVILNTTEVGFSVGAYDKTQPLVIDPILSFSSYVGGTLDDMVWGVSVNNRGESYFVGYTKSMTFPEGLSGTAPTPSTVFYAYVTKLTADGTEKIYSTYIGGMSGNQIGNAIALDGEGNVYVTGYTMASDYPITAGVLQEASAGGAYDAFVSKLNPMGDLVYSTFLGGNGFDRGAGIAVDDNNNVFVVGTTSSTDFKTTSDAVQTTFGGNNDAFVVKLDANAATVLYATYLGGTDRDLGIAIALDETRKGNGEFYVTGETKSVDFPVSEGSLQNANGGGADAFVTKLDASGTILYSTYLGGTGRETPAGIAVSRSGAYIVGTTTSSNFPTRNGLSDALRGSSDVFVTKINDSGDDLIYSTYLGGTGTDETPGMQSIAVSNIGEAFVTGFTTSRDFPIVNAISNPDLSVYPGGAASAFVAHLSNPDDESPVSIISSTYLGGSDGQDMGLGIALQGKSSGSRTPSVFLVGVSGSSNFPTTDGVLQPSAAGMRDGFVTKISEF